MSKGIIIVSEVPTHCRECDYFSMFCKITGTRLYYDKDGRMDNCPIITIRADIDGKGKNDVEEIAFDFDRAIEALEKQVKKEPYMQSDGDADGYPFWEYYCPKCNEYFDEYHPEHCWKCGQAIDWSKFD